jgi:hypothetical protein
MRPLASFGLADAALFHFLSNVNRKFNLILQYSFLDHIANCKIHEKSRIKMMSFNEKIHFRIFLFGDQRVLANMQK